ncbi:MAG: hypothetical protein ABIN18_19380 [Pseudomonadota bacterium]
MKETRISLNCKLKKKRIEKGQKLSSDIIDDNAKCEINCSADMRTPSSGVIFTSKAVEVHQKELIKIEYYIEYNDPEILGEIVSVPILISNVSSEHKRTVIAFSFANILQNKLKCLIVEFRIAEAASQLGISELSKISRSFYDFVYLPLFLLSWSFERLIKCILSLIVIDRNGEIKPVPFDTKGAKGHDLQILVNRLSLLIRKGEYQSLFDSVEEEIIYIEKDNSLNVILAALTKFAIGARYYYFNIILNGTSSHRNPSGLWDNIEQNIHSIQSKKSPPAGSPQLEKEIKQLTSEPLQNFRSILIKLFELVAEFKIGATSIRNIDTSMPYVIDFDLSNI